MKTRVIITEDDDPTFSEYRKGDTGCIIGALQTGSKFNFVVSCLILLDYSNALVTVPVKELEVIQ